MEVNFQGHYKFTVNGDLQAVGIESDSMFFTTDDQTTGWGGLRIDSGDVSSLSFCRIEFGKTSGSYPDIHGGGLALISSDAVVSNCVFADNDATGSDNGMGGAIKFTGDLGTEITGCEFLENDYLYGGGAISCYMITGTKLIYCLFADNYTMYSNGGAFNTLGNGNTLYLINCTLPSNFAVRGDGGAVNLAYAAGYFVNNIVYDNPGM